MTEWTLKTYPQTLAYVSVLEQIGNSVLMLVTQGASLKFPESKAEDVKNAIVTYLETEKRPQAAIVCAFKYSLDLGKPKVLHPARLVF